MAVDPNIERRISRRRTEFIAAIKKGDEAAIKTLGESYRSSLERYKTQVQTDNTDYSSAEKSALIAGIDTSLSGIAQARSGDFGSFQQTGGENYFPDISTRTPTGRTRRGNQLVYDQAIQEIRSYQNPDPAQPASTTGSGRRAGASASTGRVRPTGRSTPVPTTPAPSITAAAGLLPPPVEQNPFPQQTPSTPLPVDPTRVGIGMTPAKSTLDNIAPGSPRDNVAGSPAVTNNKSGGGGKVDVFGTLFDGARLLAGVLGASKGLPKYQMPPEWQMYTNRIEQLSTQGLSPEERTLAERQLQNNYATSMFNARGMTGGGGSASEAAANSIAIGQQANTGTLQLAKLDNDIRRQNLGMYGSVLQTNLSLDNQQFARDYNEAASAQQANQNLITQASASLQTRPIESQNDELWSEVLQSMKDRNSMARTALSQRNKQGPAQATTTPK